MFSYVGVVVVALFLDTSDDKFLSPYFPVMHLEFFCCFWRVFGAVKGIVLLMWLLQDVIPVWS